MHIIDSEGALCRVPDAVDADIDFADLTQYLHEATAEARRMTRDRGFRGHVCSMCACAAGTPDL